MRNSFWRGAIATALLMLVALAMGELLSVAVKSQPITQNAVSGNECWSAAQGPGGSSSWLCLGTVRNGMDLTLKSGSGAATSTATGGALYWTGAAPTTWAITLPSPAFEGEAVELGTDTTLTTMVTVTAGTGQTLNATYNSQTLTLNSPVRFVYKASTAKWYRIQ